jgi:hypothetical protein
MLRFRSGLQKYNFESVFQTLIYFFAVFFLAFCCAFTTAFIFNDKGPIITD